MNPNTRNHENITRPEAEAAQSRMKKAEEAVTQAESALAKARADLAHHESKMGTGSKLPKDFAHDGAELQAQVTWTEKLVENRRDEHTEAVRAYQQAAQELAWAMMRDRGRTIRDFDKDDWKRRVRAEIENILAPYWDELYTVQDMKGEIANLGRDYRIAENPNSYPYKDDPIFRKHEIEGYNLELITINATYMLEDAVRHIEDPRMKERKAVNS